MSDYSNSSTSSRASGEDMLLGQLKKILLQQDRKEINAIKDTLYKQENLKREVDPIIEKRIDYLKEHFPEELGVQVNRMVEVKIEESKEQLLNVIYPVLGQMIRKFVSYQFQLLKDRIDNQVQSVFSTRGLIGQIRSRIFGIKSSDLILSDLDKPVVEEVYVIQRDSGLLVGSYSRQETMDKDMIAGMLTAIRSFAQDAFQMENQELDMINYGNFKIVVQSFFSYYIAVALTGSLSSKEQGDLSELLLEFAEDEMEDVNLHLITSQLNQEISQKLEKYFTKEIFD